MISRIVIAFIAFYSACVFSEENFLLMDFMSGRVLHRFGEQIEERLPPHSTFKIALCLMGYDSGILRDVENPRWKYQEGYVLNASESWKQDQTPKSWINLSCIWFSQVLAHQIGLQRMQAYVDALQYGNRDISGDPGKINGLMRAWLGSSLKISPYEQVLFLQKLIRDELLISQYAMQMTKRLLFKEELKNGWKLFGKTGMGGNNPSTSWFIGWVEKEEQCYIFAYVMQAPTVDPSQRIPRVKQLLEDEVFYVESK